MAKPVETIRVALIGVYYDLISSLFALRPLKGGAGSGKTELKNCIVGRVKFSWQYTHYVIHLAQIRLL